MTHDGIRAEVKCSTGYPVIVVVVIIVEEVMTQPVGAQEFERVFKTEMLAAFNMSDRNNEMMEWFAKYFL